MGVIYTLMSAPCFVISEFHNSRTPAEVSRGKRKFTSAETREEDKPEYERLAGLHKKATGI